MDINTEVFGLVLARKNIDIKNIKDDIGSNYVLNFMSWDTGFRNITRNKCRYVR